MNTTLQLRIEELIAQHGGLRAAARALSCDPGYLTRLLHGQKENPNERLLESMGLKRVVSVSYERLPEKLIRASGDCICAICGETYRKHPMVEEILSYDGYPFLHRHCDGTLLKL